MQSKNSITIVHAMAGMCGMHKLQYMCIIWNAVVEVEYCTHYYIMNNIIHIFNLTFLLQFSILAQKEI